MQTDQTQIPVIAGVPARGKKATRSQPKAKIIENIAPLPVDANLKGQLNAIQEAEENAPIQAKKQAKAVASIMEDGPQPPKAKKQVSELTLKALEAGRAKRAILNEIKRKERESIADKYIVEKSKRLQEIEQENMRKLKHQIGIHEESEEEESEEEESEEEIVYAKKPAKKAPPVKVVKKPKKKVVYVESESEESEEEVVYAKAKTKARLVPSRLETARPVYNPPSNSLLFF